METLALIHFIKLKQLSEAFVAAVPPAETINMKQSLSPEQWYKMLNGAALEKMYGLRPQLLKHLIEKESQGDPLAVSHKGAKGLFQIMPFPHSDFTGNPFNPIEAIQYAAKTIAKNLQFFGNYEKALAAYNWGRKNVIQKGIHHAPDETREYLRFFKDRGILKPTLSLLKEL